MYHSITFEEKNTWDDWHLIPSSRPVFNPPAVKSKYVDIPGSDGELDLSTIFTDFPGYSDRTGSLEFIVANDYLSWDETYATIMEYLHGKDLIAILEDDIEYFYKGRFTVNEWRSDKNYSLIVLDYNVAPYKVNKFGSADSLLWDPFDFDNDDIQYYANILVEGSLALTIEVSEANLQLWEWDAFDFVYGVIQTYFDLGFNRPLHPRFTTSNAMSITVGGVTYPLPAGVSRNPEILLSAGSNEFIFTGNGVVTIEYGRRSL